MNYAERCLSPTRWMNPRSLAASWAVRAVVWDSSRSRPAGMGCRSRVPGGKAWGLSQPLHSYLRVNPSNTEFSPAGVGSQNTRKTRTPGIEAPPAAAKAANNPDPARGPGGRALCENGDSDRAPWADPEHHCPGRNVYSLVFRTAA